MDLRAGAEPYLLYDLGNLGCPVLTEGSDINDSGAVVGVVSAADCKESSRTYVWHNGHMIDLYETYKGGEFFSAAGVSAQEFIVGSGTPEKALIYRNGVTLPLSTPAGCEENDPPNLINSIGTMAVGSCCRD